MHQHIFIFSGMTAIWSFLFITELIKPVKIFDWYPPLVQKHIKSPKLLQFLLHCEKCFSGQFALWMYPVFVVFIYGVQWHPVEHICSVILSIFFTFLLSHYYGSN